MAAKIIHSFHNPQTVEVKASKGARGRVGVAGDVLRSKGGCKIQPWGRSGGKGGLEAGPLRGWQLRPSSCPLAGVAGRSGREPSQLEGRARGPQLSAAPALRRFQLSRSSRLPRAAAVSTAATWGLTKGSGRTSLRCVDRGRLQLKAKPFQTIHVPGETDSPCGGEHTGQISSCFHFSATQRVPTATGQNGGAQPPPHACHREVVRVRDRARWAEPWREVGRDGGEWRHYTATPIDVVG